MGKQYHSLLILSVVVKQVFCGMSDFASDEAECGNALVGLAPCLEYVTGDAKAPTPDCCKGLQQVIAKSPKCLCILIKDRNDPKLGFKINAPKALTLPTTCKTTAVNTSECIDLLHLMPSSPDAQIFKQFGGSPSPSPPPPGKMNGTSADTGVNSAKEKSKGTKGRWISKEKITGLVLLVLLDLSQPMNILYIP